MAGDTDQEQETFTPQWGEFFRDPLRFGTLEEVMLGMVSLKRILGNFDQGKADVHDVHYWAAPYIPHVVKIVQELRSYVPKEHQAAVDIGGFVYDLTRPGLNVVNADETIDGGAADSIKRVQTAVEFGENLAVACGVDPEPHMQVPLSS